MKWSDLGDVVIGAAPIIGGILAGPAGAAVGGIVASVFGADPNDPEAIKRAIQADPQSAVKLAEIEATHKVRLQELALQAEQMRLEDDTARLREVNTTYRKEIASSDAYVRRMRPSAGYAAILIMLMITASICYVMLLAPESAGAVSQMVLAFQIPLSGLLAIVGIATYRRSSEKMIDAGVVPNGGLIGALAERIRR